VSFTWI